VTGDFKRGDVIDIAAADGETLARGLSEYDAADALMICGKKSSELEALLGTVPRSVLVHRDQLVLL
jgi:glutamate 5-kinase